MSRVWLAARVLFTLAIALILLIMSLVHRASAAPSDVATAALACPIVLQNGSFEARGAHWTPGGASADFLITDFNPFRGQYSAELGGVANTDHSIRQQITLPATGSIRLMFWWEQDTEENAPGILADHLTINLRRTDGTLLARIDQLGVTPPNPVLPPWEQRVYDLSAYKGQTVQLEFVAHNDATNLTRFYIDEVVIPACGFYLPLIRL